MPRYGGCPHERRPCHDSSTEMSYRSGAAGNQSEFLSDRQKELAMADDLTFDAALDRVISYLAHEQDDYDESKPAQRRNHIWRAGQVLMRPRSEAPSPQQ